MVGVCSHLGVLVMLASFTGTCTCSWKISIYNPILLPFRISFSCIDFFINCFVQATHRSLFIVDSFRAFLSLSGFKFNSLVIRRTDVLSPLMCYVSNQIPLFSDFAPLLDVLNVSLFSSFVLLEQFVVHHILVYLLLFLFVIFDLFFFIMHHGVVEVEFHKIVFRQQYQMACT